MQNTFLPVKRIFADADFNSRGYINPSSLVELVKNIEQHGLLQPILVMPYKGNPMYDWKVVVGHRRYECHKLLKKETILAIINESLSESDALALNLIENLQRKDLSLMQEARAIERFIGMEISLEKVGKMLGKSYGWVQVRYNALRLPKEIQAEVEAGFLDQRDVKDLFTLRNQNDMFAAVKALKDVRTEDNKSGKTRIRQPKLRKRDPSLKTPKSVPEQLQMQGIIYDCVGNNLMTRTLAWTMGEISTQEFYQDISEHADSLGKVFMPPQE